MQNDKPTDEQIAALTAFAAANGSSWKSKLNHCWVEGCYNRYPGTEQSDLLQQIRNSFGQSWLFRLSLNKLSK